ncbi:MAG: YceD family protein [Rhodocyclaceae bacterium]|nr:YceD family protein [Rhodocyclaceae bacterium]
MSSREEQDLAGTVIDSLKFAADGGCITGKLALTSLSRLADVLVRPTGSLQCELTGVPEMGGAGGPGLHLRVSGRVGLQCQHCLAEVGFECAIDSRLLLIPPSAPEESWPADELESDEYDAMPASRELSVLELVEEEVLLALPIVPRHADCLLPAAALVGAGAEIEESVPSPFAVLAGLKKH